MTSSPSGLSLIDVPVVFEATHKDPELIRSHSSDERASLFTNCSHAGLILFCGGRIWS